MGTNPEHEISTNQSYDQVIELLIDGARGRGGNGWRGSSSAFFSLGGCAIGLEVEPTGDGATVRYRIEEGCPDFKPFAEREIRSMLAGVVSTNWITIGAIGMCALLVAAALSRGARK